MAGDVNEWLKNKLCMDGITSTQVYSKRESNGLVSLEVQNLVNLSKLLGFTGCFPGTGIDFCTGHSPNAKIY